MLVTFKLHVGEDCYIELKNIDKQPMEGRKPLTQVSPRIYVLSHRLLRNTLNAEFVQ